ncbi:MAG TPA: right-handed parallel beta-helix repeat-containing protein [Anaeromyxobacter sp.]|nr:right-handed parallel beta-helix repeat-containing protein [Anaeromyxobacter sp.]
MGLPRRPPLRSPLVLASALALALGCTKSAPASFAVPFPACTAPAALQDVSHPTATVGDGTPGSCTAAALQAAASGGGTIVFACGPAPITIPIASTIEVTKETVLDGGGLVTLSGGGGARILRLDSSYDRTTPRLTVQRLTFLDGASPRTGDDTADGGAAIYRNGGSLTVVDCTFQGNSAPAPGQDIAGGAIYGFGGGETVIVGSTFTGNSASNGGAVGSLNGDLTAVDATFTGNAAAGTGGNPGQGGCGGAIYQDGTHERTTLCGVTINGNKAGGLGGGVFRVSNDATGAFTLNASTVDSNQVTPAGAGNAGGLYLQGLALEIANSTVSRNQAYYNGGLWITGGAARVVNTTIAGNTATGSNGGGLWLSGTPSGFLLNCTIANNRSTGSATVAGAIFGSGLLLANTLVAGNTAPYSIGCDQVHASSGGNLQWPGGAPCTASPLLADPLLGALGASGGPTETLVPGPASPARGLGRSCPPFDQRGQPRAGRCTVGAVEVP